MRHSKLHLIFTFILSIGINPTVFAQTDIQTQVIQSAVYDRFVNLGGNVIPFKEVSITAQIPGQVNYIAGIEGDQFNAGDLLVSTDDDILKAQRNAAMAQWKQASFSYQNALSQYNRELWSPKTEHSAPGMALPGLMDHMFTQPFSNSMGYGDRNVDRRANQVAALSKVKEALAQMQHIKSRIDEIDVRLSDTKSLAPFHGVIVKKLVEAGDNVQPGQVLLVFANNNHLSIEVNIPVNLMMTIRKGAIYHARLADKTPVLARVAQVFPVANNQQHTVKVKFDLPIGVAAAPGMYAEVAVRNASSQNQAFPIVPKTAIIKRGSLPTLYTVNPKTQAVEMKIVRTGKSANNGDYIILSGVHSGERVIINPPINIVSGWILSQGKLIAPSLKQAD